MSEDDCQPEKGFISINQRLTYIGTGKNKKINIDVPKTKKSKRLIAIDPVLAADIKRVLHKNNVNKVALGPDFNKTELLNCHKDGTPFTNDQLRYDYEKHVALSGLPYISIHSLRHSFASNLWELEEDIKAISEMLGHSSIQITGDIYTHMSLDKKQQIVSRFGQAMEMAKAVDK